MMRHTVVNPKGRVTIPFELRKRFEITRVNRGRRARPICGGSDDFAPQERNQEDSSRAKPASRPHLRNVCGTERERRREKS
jgi:hypothetical protein